MFAIVFFFFDMFNYNYVFQIEILQTTTMKSVTEYHVLFITQFNVNNLVCIYWSFALKSMQSITCVFSLKEIKCPA